MSDFDAILPLVGSFGRYQRFLSLLLCCPFCFYLSFVVFGQVFIVLSPEHFCRVPELSSSTRDDRKSLSVPLEERDGQWEFSRCRQYDVNFTRLLDERRKAAYSSDGAQQLDLRLINDSYDGSGSNWTTVGCRHGWEYELDGVYDTPVSQGNWVCEDSWKPYLLQSVFFVGCAIGCLVYGYLADRFGRLPVLVISNSMACLSGLTTAFSPTGNFWIFAFLRFLVGTSCDTCFMVYYILVLEYVDPSKRTLVSNMALGLTFALSTSALPWIAYLVWDWRIFTVVTSAPLGTILVFWSFIPESARWLASRGRHEEAMKIVENIAKINKKEMSQETKSRIKSNLIDQSAPCERSGKRTTPTLLDLFRFPNLRKRILLLFALWFLIALCFDGHARNTHNLGFSVFYAFTVASATELPAAILVILLLDRVGRRWMFFVSLTLGGALCIGIVALPSEAKVALSSLAMFGRLLTNVSFNIGLQYAAEVLPTEVRGQGVLATHFVGYLGNILGPFVVYLGHFSRSLPLLVLGCLSALAGAICLLLPETLNEALPQTLQDGEDFGRNGKTCQFPKWTKAPEANEERP